MRPHGERIMKRLLSYALLGATLAVLPVVASAQMGGYGGPPAMSRGPGAEVPKLPGVELEGPLDSASAPVVLQLNPDQARRYAQAYDSFMVATQPQRDSA